MRCYLLPVAVCFVLFFSCSNTVPDLLSSHSSVIFDYQDEESPPLVRFAVFTEARSDVRRVSSIRIVSHVNNYEWTIDNVQIISSNGRQWAGYVNFVCPSGELIPVGEYTFFYTDAKGESAQSPFYIAYPVALAHAKARDVQMILGPDATESIAVYDSDGVLMYCDARKENWKDSAIVWDEIKTASRIRTCFSIANNTVICFMPVQERQSEEN